MARVRCGGAVAIGSDRLGIALATVLRKGARVQADHTEFHADRSVRIAAGAAVAAAGVFVSVFILKALPEFAVAAAGDSSWRFRQLALWVVLGGLLGGVLGAWRFRLVGYQRQLGWSFRGAGAVAAVALMAGDWQVVVVTALFAGVAGGWLWVVLLAGLRASAGTPRLGLTVGAGWAAAWAIGGLLEVSGAGARAMTIVAALIAATGSLTAPFLTPQEPSVSPLIHYRPAGVLRWVVVFSGLMALAAVVLSVDAPPAAGGWWAVPAMSGALLAGWAHDRGWSAVVAAIAGALMLGAQLIGLFDSAAAFGALIAVVGMAIVPVAWMAHVARGGRAWQVAGMATVAGWAAAYGGLTALAVAPAHAMTIALVASALILAGLVWRPRAG